MRLRIAGVLAVMLLFAIPVSVMAEPPHKLYMLNCMGCHGAKGKGVKGVAPSMVKVGEFLKVPGGRSYLIEVPDVRQSSLNDAQVAAVMNWVLRNFSRKSLPTNFKPYTASEVTRYRTTPLPDLAQTRKRLMKEIESQRRRE